MGTSHLCTVFDGVYSKKADGTDFYEDAVFLKYEAALKDLKPRREYQYRIVSDRCTSDVYKFRTSGRTLECLHHCGLSCLSSAPRASGQCNGNDA